MGGYVPNTKEQRLDMLKAIGLSSMEDLFVDIPQEVRLKGELEIPQGKSELEVKREMEDLAGKNRVFRTIFRGAGGVPSLYPGSGHKHHFQGKFSDGVHTVSGGSKPGHPAIDF